MNPTRRRLAAAAAALVVAAALGGPSLGTSAAAQSGDADGRYQPCDLSRTVDLLLMIDQSGSLNQPEVDEGGEIRREALQEVRDLLEDRWTVDGDGSPRGIRVALVGFDTEVHKHAARFEPAATGANSHPSDGEIEAAVQSREGEAAFTDYGEALRAAADVFGGSEADCRVMVWFTDGLHDPLPGRTAGEIDGARGLQDEVCGTIQPEFEEAGIQTFAVLLGDEFRNPEQPDMAELSMSMIHAVTGHSDSPEVDGLPPEAQCDGIDVQTGEILSAKKVDDLINTLIAAVFGADPTVWQWPCAVGGDGSEARGVPLPSRTYIDWMEALAFGGEIESYAILDDVDSDPDWQRLEANRLRLDADDLRGLSAGWSLSMRTRPDEDAISENVTLECYGKAVDQPLQMRASVPDAEGGKLAANTQYMLSVYMWPYECPVDDGKFVLEPQFPAGALPNQGCEQGQYVEFDYSCGTPDQETRVTQAAGRLTPRFSENLLRGGLDLEVQVSADFACAPPTTTTTTTTTTTPPTLDCEPQRVDGEWEGEEFFGGVAVECLVEPPAGGTSGSGAVEVATPSDGRDFRFGGAGEADRRRIDSSDLPANVVVVDDLPRQGPWDRVGEVEVALEWTQPEGADSETIGVGPEHPGWVDPLEFYPYWPTLQCAGVEEIRFAGDVPQEPLRAATQCAASGPGMGSLQLTLEWAVAADAPTRGLLESVDWGFQRQSESGEGAVLVLLIESERLDPISFVTVGPLENERYEGDGTLTMTAVWLLPWDEQRVIEAPIEVPIEVDLMRRAIWWLAALLVVAAALVSYTMLYAIMAWSARLPSAKRFYARCLEFQAQQDRAGNLTSAALDNISMDSDRLVGVKGDPSRLGVEKLSIKAEHPRWWQFGLILDGGWGQPSLKDSRCILGAHPAHSRRGMSPTPAKFTHLVVIALSTAAGAPPGTASGIVYLLVPKSPRDQDERFVAEAPNDLLRRMTATYLGEVGQTPGDAPDKTADAEPPQAPTPPPRSPAEPPPRDRTQDSAPPQRPSSNLPPRDGPPPRTRPQRRDRPEEPPPRRT